MSSRSGSSDDLDTWEVVSRVSSNEPSLEDSDSDSSIEVVSVDTDTESDLAISSSSSLIVGSSNPVFVLRVPSTEADGLSGESEESANEGDGTMTNDVQAVCHREDEEISLFGGEKTTERDEEVSQGHVEVPQTIEEIVVEPESSVDLNSSNISTSLLSTESTEDSSNSLSKDDAIHTIRCSNEEPLAEDHTLVATTSTDEGMSSMADEKSLTRGPEDSPILTEKVILPDEELTTADGSFLPLPSLPLEFDDVIKVTEPVDTPDEVKEDGRDKGLVPHDGEIVEGHLAEDNDDDDQEIINRVDDKKTNNHAVLEGGDSTEEPQQGFNMIEDVDPPIEDLFPRPPSKDGAEPTEQPVGLTSTVKTKRNPFGITKSGFTKICIIVLAVIAFLHGFMIGKIAVKTEVTEAMDEMAYLHRRQMIDQDTKIESLQRTVDWLTDNASYDLENLQSSTEMPVIHLKFTAGYEYQYFLYTYGTYAENKEKELVRRDKLTTEEIQSKVSIDLLDKVNRLEQEKADLIQQIGLMRYGSPPNASPETNAKDQEEEGQEFVWFTDDEEDHDEEDHLSDGEIEETRESKIARLEKNLLQEEARADMWQRMYMQQKESSEGITGSGKEILQQFSQLLQNLSVPEDLSENMKDKWEAVRNRSLEGWQLILDLASSVATYSTQGEGDTKTHQQDNSGPFNDDWGVDEDYVDTDADFSDPDNDDDEGVFSDPDNDDDEGVFSDPGIDDDEGDFSDTDEEKHFSDRSDSKKSSLPKWSDTIQDVYNKTKSSMSDVSQQIKKTWEQVKNLSQDLWKEHEPSVRNLQKKVTEKVEKVSEKLSTWFHRRKAYANHKQFWKHQATSDDQESTKAGSTKRRSFTTGKEEWKNTDWKTDDEEDTEEEYDDEDDYEEWEFSESRVKKIHKNFRKLRAKMDKLNFQRFMRMNLDHWGKVFRKIERFVKKVDLQVLNPHNRKWLTCQQDWWYSMCTFKKNMEPSCRDMLKDWQVDRMEGQQKGDGLKYSRETASSDRNRNKKYHKRQHTRNEQHYQNEKNRRETFENKKNERLVRTGEEYLCSMHSDDCTDSKSSWYMQQLKHRADMRSMVVDQEGKSGGGEADWMFTRAEDRDFQRTLPDDWYLRRLDNNQYNDVFGGEEEINEKL